VISCMGGFCSSRDRCADYHRAEFPIVERLCGMDEEPTYVDERMDKSRALRNAQRAVDDSKGVR